MKKQFQPGVSTVPVSGKVYDQREVDAICAAARDGWWTEGRFAKTFERNFRQYLSVKYVSLVNSGSSANLLAFAALTSAQLGKRAIQPKDEVITAACAFPTTVNPIIQYGCVPVFVDSDIATRNPTLANIRNAMSAKTRAIMLAHTLGNPLEIEEIVTFAKKHNLWVIEDCCDALGSTYRGKRLGAFGDIATFSFYPAHQITMGEGGAVITDNPLLHRAIRQFRDWGRDCWCDTGADNTCRKRFSWQLGKLPFGYDHKYIYSQIGYNMKLTDMAAAIGVEQLKKLPGFIKKRKNNFTRLHEFFQKYQTYFHLPSWSLKSEPCWFGYMLVVKDKAPFTKNEIVAHLESHKIATRALFGGNLTLHPAYEHITYKVSGKLTNADIITHNGFWIGVYPGITATMISYVKKTMTQFLKQYEKK